jgi:hypothetical protein
LLFGKKIGEYIAISLEQSDLLEIFKFCDLSRLIGVSGVDTDKNLFTCRICNIACEVNWITPCSREQAKICVDLLECRSLHKVRIEPTPFEFQKGFQQSEPAHLQDFIQFGWIHDIVLLGSLVLVGRLAIVLQNASVSPSLNTIRDVDQAIHSVNPACLGCRAAYRVRWQARNRWGGKTKQSFDALKESFDV